MAKKKYLSTSALAHINDHPHIGCLANALSADISGGIKIEVATKQEQMSIKDYIKKYHEGV